MREDGVSLLKDRSQEYQDHPIHKTLGLMARGDDEHNGSENSTEDGESIPSVSKVDSPV